MNRENNKGLEDFKEGVARGFLGVSLLTHTLPSVLIRKLVGLRLGYGEDKNVPIKREIGEDAGQVLTALLYGIAYIKYPEALAFPVATNALSGVYEAGRLLYNRVTKTS